MQKLKYALITGLLAFTPAIFADHHEEEDALDANDGEIVEFHIKKGTGRGPWNTRATMVNVKIGQTLRIINDDDIPHTLHTFNDRPCAHQGPESKTGEFYDCVIATTANPDTDLMYDHFFGVTSRFYVRATP